MDLWDKISALEGKGWAERGVAMIARDIDGRKGIGNALEEIDDKTVCAMLDGWVKMIREAPE